MKEVSSERFNCCSGSDWRMLSDTAGEAGSALDDRESVAVAATEAADVVAELLAAKLLAAELPAAELPAAAPWKAGDVPGRGPAPTPAPIPTPAREWLPSFG